MMLAVFFTDFGQYFQGVVKIPIRKLDKGYFRVVSLHSIFDV